MELLSVQGLTIAGVLSFAVAWVRFRHSSVRISQARSQRLWLLLTRHNWQTQHDAALTLACVPLVGTMHPDDIRYALTREESLLFLEARRWAKRTVRLSPDKAGYEDVRPPKWHWLRYKYLARGFRWGTGCAVPIMALNTVWLWDENIYLNALALVNAIGITSLLCALSVQFDAANRILTPGHFTASQREKAASVPPGGKRNDAVKGQKRKRQASKQADAGTPRKTENTSQMAELRTPDVIS